MTKSFSIMRGLAVLGLAAVAGTIATSQASAFMGGGHSGGGGHFGGYGGMSHFGGVHPSHMGGGYDHPSRGPIYHPPSHFPHFPPHYPRHIPTHWPGQHCYDGRCGTWPHPPHPPGCHSGYDCGPIVHHCGPYDRWCHPGPGPICNWWNHWCRPVYRPTPPVIVPPQPATYDAPAPAYTPAPAPVYSPPPAPAPAPVCVQGPMIKIVFQPTATAATITDFLKNYNVAMGDGPNPDGVYQIKLPSGMPQDQIGQLIDSMRQQTTVVSSVSG